MNRSTAILCIAAIVTSLALAARAFSKDERANLGHVQVKSLVLVDDDGKERASLCLDKTGGACFELRGGEGGTRISLYAPPVNDGHHTALVVRNGRGGKITLATGTDAGLLTVQGDTRGSVVLSSRPDTPAAVQLTGKGGPADASFHVDRDGKPHLLTMDEDQKVTIFIPKQP